MPGRVPGIFCPRRVHHGDASTHFHRSASSLPRCKTSRRVSTSMVALPACSRRHMH